MTRTSERRLESLECIQAHQARDVPGNSEVVPPPPPMAVRRRHALCERRATLIRDQTLQARREQPLGAGPVGLALITGAVGAGLGRLTVVPRAEGRGFLGHIPVTRAGCRCHCATGHRECEDGDESEGANECVCGHERKLEPCPAMPSAATTTTMSGQALNRGQSRHFKATPD